MTISWTTAVAGVAGGVAAAILDLSRPRPLLAARLLCVISALVQAEIRRTAERRIKIRNDTRLTWAQPEERTDPVTACDHALLKSWQATQTGVLLLLLQAVLHFGLKQNGVPLLVLPALSLEQTCALPYVKAARLVMYDADAPPPENWFLRARAARSGFWLHPRREPVKVLAVDTPAHGTLKETYEEAQAILQGVRIEARTRTYDVLRSKAETVSRFIYWLNRLGYMQDDLDALNAIHITGSKGKGSTAAFVNSILQGISPSAKVGRYTSPQLVTDRERISINGEPISAEMFAKYFFQIWNRFTATDNPDIQDGCMRPTYFWTLTLMAFHTFIQEGCDVSIIEVGAGARTDCTNCLQQPLVAAICSIGLAHVGELGWNTTEIAWEKGGIFKKGVPGLTIEQEEYAVHRMLERCAKENGASSFSCIDQVEWLKDIKLGLSGPHQEKNASLALNIVQAVLDSKRCPKIFAEAALELKRPWEVEVPTFIVSDETPSTKLKPLYIAASHPVFAFNAVSALITCIWMVWKLKRDWTASFVSSACATILPWGLVAWSLHAQSFIETFDHSPHGAASRPAADPIILSPSFFCGRIIRALEDTRWPGRAEVFRDRLSQATLFLDSAHTPESMELAGEWFAKTIAKTSNSLAPANQDNEIGMDEDQHGRKNILVVTFPGGVASPHKLIDSVLRGSSPRKTAESNVQRLAFDKIIAASDAVRRRGDFVLDTEYKRQRDVHQICTSLLSSYECPLDFSIEVAMTSQDVMDAIRRDARDQPCNVLVGGSIHLIGHLYDLFELPLNFVKHE